MSRIDEIKAREQSATPGPRDPKAVVKSLKWILNNVKDCGPNTFEHAIHGYVGEAIQILEDHARLTAQVEVSEAELAGYREAEQDGRLVVLPIKPGTSVWVLEKKLGSPRYDMVRERFVNSYGFSTDGYFNMQLMVPEGQYSYPVHDIYQEVDKIGKTVFLTREEAEAALESGDNNA